MDLDAFQRWWDLHLKVARGHALSPEESASYDAGRQELDRDEKLQEMQSTRAAREQLQALEAERAKLERRRQQLNCEIAAFERRLDEQARQLLGAED